MTYPAPGTGPVPAPPPHSFSPGRPRRGLCAVAGRSRPSPSGPPRKAWPGPVSRRPSGPGTPPGKWSFPCGSRPPPPDWCPGGPFPAPRTPRKRKRTSNQWQYSFSSALPPFLGLLYQKFVQNGSRKFRGCNQPRKNFYAISQTMPAKSSRPSWDVTMVRKGRSSRKSTSSSGGLAAPAASIRV